MNRLLLALLLVLAAPPCLAQSGSDWEGYGDGEIEEDNRRRGEREAEDDAGNEALDLGTEILGWGMGTYESADEFMNDWESLDRDQQEQLLGLLQLLTGELEDEARAAFVPPSAPGS